MTETIRIGVIGAGANTKLRHNPGLRAIAGVEIVGVCNRTLESSQAAAQALGIPKIYRHWCELIEDDAVDAVVIGTWPYLHCPATVAALENGKHVLCEARMAMNAEEAHRMWEAARMRPHLVAQLVPAPFTLPLDASIRRILAEGHIGRPLLVEVRDHGAFIDPKAPLHWRQNSDLNGMNMMTLGIWYETVMRWLGEATAVFCLSKTVFNLRRDQDKLLRSVRLPDHLDVLAEMACGAQLHLQISTFTALTGPTEAFVIGDKGVLRIAEGKLFGGQHGGDHLQEIPAPPDLVGKWRVEEEFINAVRGIESVKLTTFEDGVKYMEFTEAVFRSSRSGMRVDLPLR